ncbi:very-long-chain (3R)-3-hydroxyacyl-CoA dehydratase isoform X2 [Bacillus rossius redtenbacheri]|uniref:very-long-chain (3R)-3-hydroxyacyl-CoA dehydratase isoform X2 n=1 Tax=Bacillus rossius redtenbacheri TaxID=93214 RepID=UPI002FDC92C8
MPEVLSPFVYWAQTENNLTLKVDLKDVKDPDVVLEDEEIRFGAHGYGARGLNKYSFALHFHSAINPKECQVKVSGRNVEFVLKKKEVGWWPRITGTPQKPAWLKIDFDRWKSEDDVNEDEARDIVEDYPNLYDKLLKDELGYRKEDFKKVYMILYNLVQFVGFSYILIVMGIRYYRDGPDSMEGTYEAVGDPMKFCQLLQFLEVMHPIFGYTKGSALVPALQVTGRAIILFCMIESEPRIQDKPVVFYLFLVWAVVEIFRYPYYITQVYKINIRILTWLRYTMWIPLYPLGFLCEGVIVLRNIPYFEETQRFTVSLPNSWNFAFHFPTVMRLYLLFLFFPV